MSAARSSGSARYHDNLVVRFAESGIIAVGDIIGILRIFNCVTFLHNRQSSRSCPSLKKNAKKICSRSCFLICHFVGHAIYLHPTCNNSAQYLW